MQLQPAHSMTAEAGSCMLGKRKSDVGDYVEPTDADSFQARKRGRLQVNLHAGLACGRHALLWDWQRTILHPVLQDGPAFGDERMQFGVLSEVSLEASACPLLRRACACPCLHLSRLSEWVLPCCRGWTLVQKACLLHRAMCHF